MMWTGVLSAAAPRRTSCSKKGTSAPGCWKAFCAESARYSSILRCAAARAAGAPGGAGGRLGFFFGGFLCRGARGGAHRRRGGPFGFLLGRFLFRGGRLRGGSLGRTGQQAAAHEGRYECQENPVAHHSSVVGNAALPTQRMPSEAVKKPVGKRKRLMPLK